MEETAHGRIRDHRAALRRKEALRPRYRLLTLKDAAFGVMEEAYLKAGANGTLPANARQIYYAARGPIKATGRESSTATISPRRCL